MLFSASVGRGWLERDQDGQCWRLTLLTGACVEVELGLGIGPAAELGTEALTGLQELAQTLVSYSSAQPPRSSPHLPLPSFVLAMVQEV